MFRSLLLVCCLLPGVAAAADHLDASAWEARGEAWLAAGAGGSIAFPDAVALHVRDAFPWAGGARVRLAQTVLGVPVIGHEVVLSYGLDGALRRVAGEPVAAALLDPTPQLPAGEAEQVAQALVSTWFGAGERWPARSSLAVWLQGEQPRLVWDVRASTAAPLANWRVLVDAHGGSIVQWAPDSFDARGDIYPTNPMTSDLQDVDIPRASSTTLQGTYAFVNSCEVFDGNNTCTSKVRQASPTDGDWYFDPDPRGDLDPFSELQMYYHLDYISEWFDARYGFRHAQGIEGIVNFEYQNAFYGDFDGDNVGEVAFGEYGAVDLAYDSDVVYHEFMHSVFGRVVSGTGFLDSDEYGMEWASGGLNEGSADALSLVHNQDPDLGEYAGRAFFGGIGPTPIRQLGELRTCPEDLYGESHRDGEVWGALAWQLIDDERVGADVTADLYYGAITGFPDDLSWATAGQALETAADDLLDEGVIGGDTHGAIIEWAERSGVLGCGRVVAMDEGAEPQQLLNHPGFFPDANLPLGNQFSVEAPEAAGRIRFRVTDWRSSNDNLAWRLYVRRGQHVGHDITPVNLGNFQIEVPVPADYDFAIDGQGDGFELAMLPGGSELEGGVLSDGELLPLQGGATYYFSIASRAVGNIQGFAQGEITTWADMWIDPGLLGDDDDDDGGEGAGCAGCASNLGGASGGLLLLLVPWVRRRR